MDSADPNQTLQMNAPLTLSTESISRWYRREWLQEVIGREYAHVEIIPSKHEPLFNEMNIYSWQDLRLSVIHSNSLSIERLPTEPTQISQDAYFAVVLLSGKYQLEQHGREVFLEPGDMAIYDAARPHRIHCDTGFSKLIVSIPRKTMMERLPYAHDCTAIKICGDKGEGALTSQFIRSVANEVRHLSVNAFEKTAEQSLDLLTLALNSVSPRSSHLTRSKSVSLLRVKDFVSRHLTNSALNTELIANGTGLSARYINELFIKENTSLMRYVWERRLMATYWELNDSRYAGRSISEIAVRWGFNDLSHFSRAFKLKYGMTPRSIRQISLLKTSESFLT